MIRVLASVAAFGLMVGATAPAHAQFPCPEPQWQPFRSAIPGPNGYVSALALLPGGELLAAGGFTNIGGIQARGIARWDSISWSPLGIGVSGGAVPAIHSMARRSDGSIVAGGQFTMAGGEPASCIARWDGAAWSRLGLGTAGPVYAVTLRGDDLLAAGQFAAAGGSPANNIARWDGTSWSALGSGLTGGSPPYVYALLTVPGGDVVAGGDFTTAGGTPAIGIACWNGGSWSGLGGGMDGYVTALITMPGGDLVAGGGFTAAGGVPANGVARWGGVSWTAMGAGPGFTPISFALLPGGDLASSGYFFGGGGVARWDGAAWVPLASLSNPPVVAAGMQALTVLPGGDLLAGGSFSIIGAAPIQSLVRYTCDPLACPGEPFGITVDGWWPDTCYPDLLHVQIEPGRIDIVTGWCPQPPICFASVTYYQIFAPLPGLPGGTYDVYQTVELCGNVKSRQFVRTVTVGEPGCPCYANCDGSSAPAALTIADFGCFQARFVQGDPYADCNGDSGLTVGDFACFQARFASGCP